MFCCRVTAVAAFMALQGSALALPDAAPLREQGVARHASSFVLAQAKRTAGDDSTALYRQCRAAVVRTYGRASGLRDANQDSLNAEVRMEEAATLESKIDYCIRNGGRP